MPRWTSWCFLLGAALTCVGLAACAVEPTTAGDCDLLVSDDTEVAFRDDFDVLVVLDVTGRVPVTTQAELIARFLRPAVTGDRDDDGRQDFEPPTDVHVAFITGGVGTGCDEAAAIALDTCADVPFIAFGTAGPSPRPSVGEVEAAIRCAVSLPRPTCADNQPFEAAALALAESASTGFPHMSPTVVAIGGPGACDGPTGTLRDPALYALFGSAVRPARICTDADAATVSTDVFVWFFDRTSNVCVPRDVQHDDAGIPACIVDETIAWPDRDACAALALKGREAVPVGIDAVGHATCRMRPLALPPDGFTPPVGAGFYILSDVYSDTIAACGEGRSLLHWTLGAEPLPGSSVRIRCVAALSVCR